MDRDRMEFIRAHWPRLVAPPHEAWFRQASVEAVFELGGAWEKQESRRKIVERLAALRAKKRARGRPARKGDDYAEHVLGELESVDAEESLDAARDPLDFDDY